MPIIPPWVKLLSHVVAAFVLGVVGALTAAVTNMAKGEELTWTSLLCILATGLGWAAKEWQSRMAEPPKLTRRRPKTQAPGASGQAPAQAS